MGFAGIFEAWKNPQATSEDDQWLRTFAIITRPAPDVVGHIHDRSPVVVPAELWDDWLSPQIQDDHEIASLLDAIGSPHLHPRRVSKAVGNVRNNNPSLVEEM